MREEVRAHNKWKEVIAELVQVEEKQYGQQFLPHQVSEVEKLLFKAKELSAAHKQACVRLTQSQAPSEDIEEATHLCQEKRLALEVRMGEFEEWFNKMKPKNGVEMSDVNESSKVGRTASSKPPSTKSAGKSRKSRTKSSSSRSTVKSRDSAAAVKIQMENKMKELHEKMKLQQLEEAEVEATKATAMKKKLQLQREMIEADLLTRPR